MTNPANVATDYDGTHLAPEDGSPVLDLGPHDVEPLGPTSLPSAAPTRKWVAARVTALAGWAVLVIATGFGDEAAVALVGILAEAAVSYLTPNAAEPGGVKPK